MISESLAECAVHASSSHDQISANLRAYTLSLGAELYGVASAQAYAEHFPDKPQPTQFVEGARSVIIIGLPFEPGTVAAVLRPELAALRAQAADQFASTAVQPAKENSLIQAIDGEGWKNPFACAAYGCCGACIAICPVDEI